MNYSSFSDADWARIERDWTAWWHGTLERPLVYIVTRDPAQIDDAWISSNLVQFSLDTPLDDLLDHFEARLDAVAYHGDAFPHWWLNAGAGIVAAFLGSSLSYSPEAGGTTWFWPLGAASLAEIQPVYDPDNDWWRHCQAVMDAAVRRWGDGVTIGQTDLGGNLDILASLRGTHELLMDLHDAPEEVDRLTRTITQLWMRYYDELDAIIQRGRRGGSYWAGFWSPGRGYMLQSDFCYMISPAMFERFMLPDLRACCEFLEYPFYHLDGKGQLIHLERILSIPSLCGVQWQPGDGQPLADDWLDVLKQIRDAGKLCQVFVTREGAQKITRELGGTGFMFMLIEDLTPYEADQFVETMLSPC